ncbi:hypothetical protein HanPSC8_Chr10g0415131 [Helianthus annuus]|nr:hypothetical protein HanPSC8_Chr10g0415131 [Helianthus annuus]
MICVGPGIEQPPHFQCVISFGHSADINFKSFASFCNQIASQILPSGS